MATFGRLSVCQFRTAFGMFIFGIHSARFQMAFGTFFKCTEGHLKSCRKPTEIMPKATWNYTEMVYSSYWLVIAHLQDFIISLPVISSTCILFATLSHASSLYLSATSFLKPPPHVRCLKSEHNPRTLCPMAAEHSMGRSEWFMLPVVASRVVSPANSHFF